MSDLTGKILTVDASMKVVRDCANHGQTIHFEIQDLKDCEYALESLKNAGLDAKIKLGDKSDPSDPTYMIVTGKYCVILIEAI